MAKTTRASNPKATAPAAAETAPQTGTDAVHFEQSLGELEALVERLEQGDLPLEESLATFERGIHLSRHCQKALDEAEQRVRILTETSASAEPIPFNPTVS
nr:exodeoxyribonuclease VII small subunit [Rhabdochromatium marinum]